MPKKKKKKPLAEHDLRVTLECAGKKKPFAEHDLRVTLECAGKKDICEWRVSAVNFIMASARVEILNGPPPNSGPPDVATKNSFPLFFVGGKGLVHIYQNHFN